MGKTRDLFKKIRDTKGTFHGHNKGQKRSLFIPIPKKDYAKKCSNYHTIALISHTNKVMLNILQARLQQYIKLATSVGSSKKQESSRKTSISA